MARVALARRRRTRPHHTTRPAKRDQVHRGRAHHRGPRRDVPTQRELLQQTVSTFFAL